MSSKGFRERILEVYVDGTALASSTTETSLLPNSGYEATLGAGRLKIGAIIAFAFSGRISTVVTTPGNLTLALRFNSIDVFSSGAMPLNIVAQTNIPWTLTGELVVRAVGTGTAANLMPKNCIFTSRALVGASAAGTAAAGSEVLPYNTAPVVGSGFDFSLSQLIDFMGQFSVSNAANSIQLHAGSVDVYTQ